MGKSRKRKRNYKKKKQNYSNSNKTHNKSKKTNDKKEIHIKIKMVMDEIESKNEFHKISPVKMLDDGGWAYNVADALASDLRYTQLRNFYAHIKKIERKCDTWDDIKPELYLLKPRLASKFVQNYIPYGFYALISLIIDKIDSGTESDKKLSFKRFVEFFEATVAFHKYLGEQKDV